MASPSSQTLSSRFRIAWVASRTVILTGAIVAASMIGLRQLGVLQPLELGGFDQLVRLRPPEEPDPRLLIVGITDDDIRSRNEYPISDRTVLQLLETLEQHQPLAIGLDVIRDVPIGPGHAELLEYMRQSDRLITACKVRDQAAAGFPPPSGLEMPQIGAVNLGVDPDGVLRRALLTLTPPAPDATTPAAKAASICDDPKDAIPYFGLQLAILYLDAMGVPFEVTQPQQYIKFGTTTFQPLEPNTGPYRSAYVGGKQGYQLLINYRETRKVAQEVSLTDVLNNKVDPTWIKDHIVLIGYTARSVKDELFTPFNQGQNLPPMPGVVAHAQIVSQILSAVLDQRPLFWLWSPWLEGAWIVGWALVGGILAWQIRRPIVLILAITSLLSVLAIGCYVLLLLAGWVPLIPPALALVLTATGVVLFSRGYAQAIYQGVKGFLKLDIEIDVAQKQREVAEITESDYFKRLKIKTEQLKQQKAEPTDDRLSSHDHSSSTVSQPSPSTLLDNLPIELDISTLSALPTESTKEPADLEALDFLQDIQQKGQELCQRHHEPPASTPSQPEPVPAPSPANLSDSEFFQHVQRQSQALRQQRAQQASIQSTSPLESLPPAESLTTPSVSPVLPDPSPSPQPALNSDPSQPQSSLAQLLEEIDEYYRQLKNNP